MCKEALNVSVNNDVNEMQNYGKPWTDFLKVVKYGKELILRLDVNL